MSLGLGFRPPARFELRRHLGEGGMGVVYEAFDRERQSTVALKTLKNLHPAALVRLKREFRALVDLEHTGLARLHELLESDGQWFFTMELVPGKSLGHWLRDEAEPAPRHTRSWEDEDTADRPFVPPPTAAPRVDEARLRDVFRQLAEALAALHAAGKVHRDVKPSNVLVTDAGRVVLVDFGLVRELDTADTHSDGGRIAGTATYMAPEQAASKPVGPAADWYGLGAMLYELLTGRTPHQGTLLQVLMAKQTELPPSPETLAPGLPEDLVRLCMRLLAIEPEARPSPGEILRVLGGAGATSRARTSPPARSAQGSREGASFVGRGAELAVLRDAFVEAAGGQARIVVVYGESGIGKSELCRHFLADVARGGRALVLTSRCYEREAVPYKAFDGIADGLARELGRWSKEDAAALRPRRAALLAQMFPVLERVAALVGEPLRGPGAATGSEAQEQRGRLFGAFRELFERLRDRRPVVLLVDDMQWSDRDSLLLMEDLLREPPPALLFVAAVRTTDEAVAKACVPERLWPLLRTLRVPGLPAEDAARLFAMAMPDGAAGAERLASLLAEAEGHPLMLLELAHHQGEPGAEQGLALDDVIRQRVAQLPDAARTLLELCAVASAPVPRRVLVTASSLEHTAFERAASLLRVARLAQGHERDGEVRLETYHDRVRESVLASLQDGPRRAYHAALGEAMLAAGLAQSEPQRLVRHLEAAGEAERAARLAARAAEAASAALAFDHAIELYGTALRLGSYAPAERRALTRRLAAALASAGRGPEAAEAYLAAAQGADAGTRLDDTRRAIEQLLQTGHLGRGRQLARALFAELGIALPEAPGAVLASLLWHRARLRLRGYAWTSRPPMQIAEGDLLRVDVLRGVATGVGLVEPVLGQLAQTRALLEVLPLGEDRRIVKGLILEALFLASQGPAGLRRARALHDRARAATAAGDAHVSTWLGALEGGMLYFAARPAAAAETIARSRHLLAATGENTAFEADSVLLLLALSLMHAGRLADMRRVVDEALRDAERRGDRFLSASLGLTAVPVGELAADRPEAARAALAAVAWDAGTGGVELQDWYRLEAEVLVALYDGSAPWRVGELLPRLAQVERALVGRVDIVRDMCRWAQGRLLVAAARQDRRHLAAAARVADTLARGHHYGPRQAPALRAAIAAASGRTDEALAALRATVVGAADQLLLLRAAAQHRLGQLAGADEARAAAAAASAWAAREGVARMDRLAEVVVPWGTP